MKVLAAFLLLATSAWADTIHLKNGGTLEGVVLKKNEDGVIIALKYATVTVGSFEIESMDRVALPSAAAPARVADWQACFQSLATRSWGPDLHPLPSPVIVDGVFKNVPYVTHGSGDFQFVLYGDPDAPACIELGISGVSLPLDRIRQECLDVFATFLRDHADVETLRTLAMGGDKKEREGLVFEVDKEPDSRGKETWWISVSDPKALESARLPENQLSSMIVAEPPQSPRNPTLVEKQKVQGERQEVITPFGTEPKSPHRKRRYGGGRGYWPGLVHWNHGHPTAGVPHK
jgi:hypothetical protein